MKHGGFISKEELDKIMSSLKEKPLWWLVDGKLVHCCSWELEVLHKTNGTHN